MILRQPSGELVQKILPHIAYAPVLASEAHHCFPVIVRARSVRASRRFNRRSLARAFLSGFGAIIDSPVESVAKALRPRSTPTGDLDGMSESGWAPATITEINQRSASRLTT